VGDARRRGYAGGPTGRIHIALFITVDQDLEGAPQVGFKHSTGCTLQIPLNLLVQAAQLHPELPVSLWVMGEPGLAPDHRIFRKGAGDAQVSPLHHACLFPCHPMLSIICSCLPSPGEARTDRVRHALRGRSSKRGSGRLDLIFRCSCLKAFTPSPPLTPVPCRSDDSCDKNEANARRSRQFRHAEKRRRTRQDRAKSRCAGAW
jgi:hypothetical protein